MQTHKGILLMLTGCSEHLLYTVVLISLHSLEEFMISW